MENFIGNNADFVVNYGQYITGALVLLSLFLIFKLVRRKRSFLRILGAFFFLALGTLSGLVFARVTSIKPRMTQVLDGLENLNNQSAPALSFTTFKDGKTTTLDTYKGKVVLLNYWATWCPPCVKEMPELNKLQVDYQDKGLVVLALSDEKKERLDAFNKKKPFLVEAAYTTTFDWANIKDERPMTFLINREGVIVDYFTGGYSYEFFKEKVLEHL